MGYLHTSWIWQIAENTSLAYLDSHGKLELRPYLDVRLSRKIWGIAVNGIVFKLTHEADTDWFSAQNVEPTKFAQKLPHTSELDIGFAAKEAFNQTIEVLKSRNICADYWRDGWYWTSENAEDKGVVVDMANGKAEIVAKNMRNGYVRLCSCQFHNPRVLSLGFSLVYLIDGIFKHSDELMMLKRFKPWGLHITKRFLSLTEEDQKINWYEATKKAASMSNTMVTIGLPEKDDVDFMNQYRDAINGALIALKGYGVEADLIDKTSPYLTNCISDENYILYNFRRIPKDEPHLCRYVGKNAAGIIFI